MVKEALTLSVPETARALGIGLNSVYRAVRENRLPALRVGTKPKLRIPRQVVERLMEDPTAWGREAKA